MFYKTRIEKLENLVEAQAVVLVTHQRILRNLIAHLNDYALEDAIDKELEEGDAEVITIKLDNCANVSLVVDDDMVISYSDFMDGAED